jgi:Protein of unknown function (DUF2950)
MSINKLRKWFSWKDEGVGMIRLSAARMSFPSSGKFLCALVAIGLCSVGCNRSQQSAVPAGPQTFASADVAGQTIYAAAKAGDTNALLSIFGSGAKDLLLSGDPVQDKAALDTFSNKYDEMHRWGKLTQGGLVLDVGAENYPFPFALKMNSAGQWYFDTSSAKNEILARRIGGNELSTIEVLNAMKDAQAEYFSQLHDGSKAHAYAQKFVSDDGKQNGLYWKVGDGQVESPLGPLAAYASNEGYSSGSQGQPPYHGYFFRMITKQGPQAQGGAKDYIVNGTMTGGFAILAYPAEYANSGVMSFVINQDGNVFEKDLGANTSEVAKTITSYDPDNTWSAVE